MKNPRGLKGVWRRYSVCALLLALMVPAAHALDPGKTFQEYVSDSWGTEQGLPQITVLAIAQDRSGYMWFGTQDGVARFDGASFRNYLPSEWVQALLVDQNGTLWAGLNKGVAVYRDHHFETLEAAPGATADFNAHPDVRALVQQPDGTLLAASGAGLLRVSSAGLAPDPGLIAQPLFSLLYAQGALWAGGEGMLYEQRAGAWQSHPAPGGADTRIQRLCLYQNALWAGTSRGLYRYTADGWQRLAGDPAELHLAINACFVDSAGNFWVATNAGLARVYDAQLAEFVPAGTRAAAAQVEALAEDREHDLWIGTHAHGVMRLWNGFGRRFTTPEGLGDTLVWSLTPAANGGLWVGTANGVYWLHQGRFVSVIPGGDLPEPDANTLLDDGEMLWVGTKTGVAVYYHGRVRTPAVLAPMATSSVQGMLRDHNGVYWFATSRGLYRYADAKLQHFGESAGLTDPRCRLLYETRDGRLLVGTLSGLYQFENGHFLPLGQGTELSHAFVTAITELANGWLLVGTFHEHKLYLYDGTHWRALTAAEGLPANTASYMTADAAGQWLWVGGIRGIYRLGIASLTALVHGSGSRLDTQWIMTERGDKPGSAPGYCCNGTGNAHGLFQDGQLWLPTRDGVVMIDTTHISFNTVVPDVVVEGVRFDGTWQHNDGKPLRVPPRYRDLSFRFSVLSFQNPDSVSLLYRLAGYDPHWQQLEDVMNRRVNYTNLPPGDYSFEVRGSNNAGVWNPVTASLGVVLEPYFYETLWFWVLLALGVLLLVYAGYRLQVRHLRRQRLQLEHTVAERTEALRKLNQQLEEASQTDPLTGLKNRRYLAQQLPLDMAQFRRELNREGGRDQAMVFAALDLDHFKDVNDRYGHFAGDEILKQFAAALQEIVRAGHYLIRWGGEEFLIVFRAMPRAETEQVIARVHATLGTRCFTTPGSGQLALRCSIGFVEHPFVPGQPDTVDLETLFNMADQALYAVKSGGRNGWAVLRPGPNFNAASLREDLHRGLLGLLLRRKLLLRTSLPGTSA